MKTIVPITLLLAAALLAACEQKPYQPPVPHTEPEKPAGKAVDNQKNPD